MAGYLADWKKNKPTTLLKEPLSAALKELDEAVGGYVKNGTRVDIAKVGPAIKGAKLACDETIKKCNPTLHKQGIAYVQNLGKKLDVDAAGFKKDQVQLATFLTDIGKHKTRIVTALTTSAAKPGVSVAQVGQKQAQDFLTWMNTNKSKVTSREIDFVVQKATRAKDTLGEMVKILSASSVNDAHVRGIVGEIKTVAKELAQPTKFADVTVSVKASDKPFGQG